MTEPEPSQGQIDLRRRRDVGALIADGFGAYLREFRTFILIAIAVVVPVELIVGGVGLGQFTGEYDRSPSTAHTAIQFATGFFLIMPLTTAMSIYALLDMADGRKPSAASAIQRGLDVFPPLLLVTLMYAAGVFAGLLLLILPGIYLLVRWAFFVQTTVVEKRRLLDALEGSGEIVRGSWLRVLLVVLAVNIIAGGLSALVGAPLLAAAEATGDAVFQLLGQMLGGVLFSAPSALILTLLYFDVRTRKGR